MSPVFADFFAGIGLVRVALESHGWTCVFANDIDPAKHRMYADNFEADHYVLGDIANLHGCEVPCVDLAHASFPCVDLSLAGGRAGLCGKESGTVWEFIRILREMSLDRRSPRLVTLENVAGWITSHDGKDLRSVIAALNQLGYVCDVFLIDAIHFVPQSRPRVFVVGHLGRHQIQRPFTDEEKPGVFRPAPLLNFMNDNRDLEWGLFDLPESPIGGPTLKDILDALPDDHPQWWPPKRVEYFLAQTKQDHRRLLEEAANRDGLSVFTAYRRMRNGKSTAEIRGDGVAGCLRTPRGGSSRQILVVAGRGKLRVRLLTAREYARLQGVPEWYKISVPYNQALWGFGDAVCVPAVAWIAENVLNPVIALEARDLLAATSG